MSSLRNLLDAADVNLVPSPTYYGEANSHQIWFRGGHCWTFDNSYEHHRQYLTWCVPTRCICKVKFEIWGGGGGGGGSCCCMTHWPGYSGQYQQCTVCAADRGVNQLDGCCYDICVASGTCRHPGNGGYDGCKTFIIGPGLDAFCACGGCHGHSCCFGHAYYGGACTTRLNWMVGEPWNRWQTDKYSCDRQIRACCNAEGKDYWGSLGAYNQSDCADCGNWCVMKRFAPFAPNQDARMGTWSTVRYHTMASCGRTETLWLTGNNGGLSGDCFRNGPPGMGAMGSDTHGGGCCCGSEGAYGLVKISVFCKQ